MYDSTSSVFVFVVWVVVWFGLFGLMIVVFVSSRLIVLAINMIATMVDVIA